MFSEKKPKQCLIFWPQDVTRKRFSKQSKSNFQLSLSEHTEYFYRNNTFLSRHSSCTEF